MNDFMKRLMLIATDETKPEETKAEEKKEEPKTDEPKKDEAKPAPVEKAKTKKQLAEEAKAEKAKQKESEVNWVDVMNSGASEYQFDEKGKRIKIVTKSEGAEPKTEIVNYEEAKLPEGFEEALDKVLPELHKKKHVVSVPDTVIMEKLTDLNKDMKKDVYRLKVIEDNYQNVKSVCSAIQTELEEANTNRVNTAVTIADTVFKSFAKGKVPQEVMKYLNEQGLTNEVMSGFLKDKEAVQELSKQKIVYESKKSELEGLLETAMKDLAEALEMYQFAHGAVRQDSPSGRGHARRQTTDLDVLIGKVKAVSPATKVELAEKLNKDILDEIEKTLVDGKDIRSVLEKKIIEFKKINMKAVTKYTVQLVETDTNEIQEGVFALISEEIKSRVGDMAGKKDYGPDFTNPDHLTPKQDDAGKKPVDEQEAKELAEHAEDIPREVSQKKIKESKESMFLSWFDKIAATDLGNSIVTLANEITELIQKDIENRETLEGLLSQIDSLVGEKAPAKEEAKVEEKETVNAKRLSNFDKKADVAQDPTALWEKAKAFVEALDLKPVVGGNYHLGGERTETVVSKIVTKDGVTLTIKAERSK